MFLIVRNQGSKILDTVSVHLYSCQTVSSVFGVSVEPIETNVDIQ